MPRSVAERNWLLGGIAGAVVLIAVAWFFAIHPQMGKTDDLKRQTADAQSQNAVQQSRTSKLKADNANINALAAALKEARAALPTDSGLPELTRQLAAQAAASSVQVVSITAGSPAVATGAAAGAASGTSGATVGSLFSIPMTLVSDGTAVRQQQFLAALQTVGPRRVLVTAVTLAPSGTGNTSSIDAGATMTITLQAFVSPQSDAAIAALARSAAAVGAK
ncbi:hypothetical protein ACSMXN_18015 [Jatrophihabitans sp. DSM 45814]